VNIREVCAKIWQKQPLSIRDKSNFESICVGVAAQEAERKKKISFRRLRHAHFDWIKGRSTATE